MWDCLAQGHALRGSLFNGTRFNMADHPAEPVSETPIRAEIAGNRLELIESGEERLALLLELMGGAKQCIKMLMYMFNSDEAGRAVQNALAEAARRGVEVRLMID